MYWKLNEEEEDISIWKNYLWWKEIIRSFLYEKTNIFYFSIARWYTNKLYDMEINMCIPFIL